MSLLVTPLASVKALLKAEGCTKPCSSSTTAKSNPLPYFLIFLFCHCFPDFSTSGPRCLTFHQDSFRYKPRKDHSPSSETTFFFSYRNSHIQPM